MNQQLKFFKVVCKCGHVGKKHYVPIAFAIKAYSKKEAAAIAKSFPRVKHHHKDAVISVDEIDVEDYWDLKEVNNNNSYLKCKCIQDQRRMCENISDVIEAEAKYLEYIENKNIKKEKRISRLSF